MVIDDEALAKYRERFSSVELFENEIYPEIERTLDELLRGKGLGHEILRLGLMEASKLGISEVMTICAETNISSQRVLMRRGRFESRRKNGEIVYMLDNEGAKSARTAEKKSK